MQSIIEKTLTHPKMKLLKLRSVSLLSKNECVGVLGGVKYSSSSSSWSDSFED